MAKYYFTYEGDRYSTVRGLEPRKQPFKGGWTEVEANSFRAARAIYNGAHPEIYNREEYSGYDYCLSDDEFAMLFDAEKGINGLRCVERISLKVDVIERGAMNA